MIQRIQTVYLLISVALLTTMMFLTLGTFVSADNVLTEMTSLALTQGGSVVSNRPWALFAELAVADAVVFVTIFLYKKRMLQIRLATFAAIILVGWYATLFIFIYIMKDEAAFSYSWHDILPLVAILADWMAIRAIGADEVLVRSYDRLR